MTMTRRKFLVLTTATVAALNIDPRTLLGDDDVRVIIPAHLRPMPSKRLVLMLARYSVSTLRGPRAALRGDRRLQLVAIVPNPQHLEYMGVAQMRNGWNAPFAFSQELCESAEENPNLPFLAALNILARQEGRPT